MTLEQRAETLMVVVEMERRLTPKKAQKLIIEAFQILIKDCAKIAADYGDETSTWDRKHAADDIAEEIRALAEQPAPRDVSGEVKEYCCGYNTVSGAFHKPGCTGECGITNPGEAVKQRRIERRKAKGVKR